jgi:succinyl-diaminopimelate desuccinylase
LVATPSLSGEEYSVSELLANQLSAIGYRDVGVDEYGNVVGFFGNGEPKLMFNGHIDHVPPAGMPDPYGGKIVDGSRWSEPGPALLGRGSCDMKANVAAGAYAIAFLQERASRLKHSYVFTADVREEIDGPEGIQSLLSRGIRAQYGISGEPTRLRVAVGHRGKVQFDVTVLGRSSHASTPNDGRNAVYQAIPILRALEHHRALSADARFGPGTITATGISSEPGGDTAVVPSKCTIRVDRRYVPGETPQSCQNDIEELVSRVSHEHRISASVQLVNVYPLMSISEDHKLTKEAREAVRMVTGETPELIIWPFGVNATFMSAAGIPSLGIGPGDGRYAHTPEEHVPVSELAQASRIYANLIERLCC